MVENLFLLYSLPSEENLAQVFFKDDRQQERGGKKSPSEPTEEV